jgi:hypothetical protein
VTDKQARAVALLPRKWLTLIFGFMRHVLEMPRSARGGKSAW